MLRFARTEAIADIQDSILYACEAVTMTPRDNAEFPKYLGSVLVVLQDRFEHTRLMEHLDELIVHGLHVIDMIPNEDEILWNVIGVVELAMSQRVEMVENMEGFDIWVNFQKMVVDVTPIDHPDMAKHLQLLSYALVKRFDHSGSADDLLKFDSLPTVAKLCN